MYRSWMAVYGWGMSIRVCMVYDGWVSDALYMDMSVCMKTVNVQLCICFEYLFLYVPYTTHHTPHHTTCHYRFPYTHQTAHTMASRLSLSLLLIVCSFFHVQSFQPYTITKSLQAPLTHTMPITHLKTLVSGVGKIRILQQKRIFPLTSSMASMEGGAEQVWDVYKFDVWVWYVYGVATLWYV